MVKERLSLQQGFSRARPTFHPSAEVGVAAGV